MDDRNRQANKEGPKQVQSRRAARVLLFTYGRREIDQEDWRIS